MAGVRREDGEGRLLGWAAGPELFGEAVGFRSVQGASEIYRREHKVRPSPR